MITSVSAVKNKKSLLSPKVFWVGAAAATAVMAVSDLSANPADVIHTSIQLGFSMLLLGEGLGSPANSAKKKIAGVSWIGLSVVALAAVVAQYPQGADVVRDTVIGAWTVMTGLNKARQLFKTSDEDATENTEAKAAQNRPRRSRRP